MAYKFRLGKAELSGSMTTDDIMFSEDEDTGFDFEQDYIGFNTDGSTSMVLSGSRVGIGTTNPDYRLQVAGNIGVNQYIYHNGDANTWINFTDNRIRLNAGGNNFIDCEDPGSAPHKVRINNGGNNIDFVIKNNSNNVYFTADASTSRIGIGTETPGADLTINGTEPRILFTESDSDRAEIYINDSDNLLINNMSTNKHIVFKSNDNGVIREGLRVGGVQPEVVVNEGSDSLVDFRVESDNQTHMVYVDGSLDRVGINKSNPESSLHVGGSLSLNLTIFNSGNDPGTTYSCIATDCVILINTRPTAQGGIDSTLSITLPDCASAAGRVIIIKDAGGYSDVNSITINRQGSDTINGLHTSVTLNNAGDFKRLISDGDSQWHEI